MRAPTRPTTISGISTIADNYDAFLLDQFGVLHDGKHALPGAIDCFDRLVRSGKQLIVLSNTSRRRDFARGKLPGLGFDDASLAGFVCSGEEAWRHMARNCRGQRCVWLSWSADFHAWQGDYLTGTDVTLASADEADFVLCHGSQRVRTDKAGDGEPTGLQTGDELSAYADSVLARCASRGLPMVCANPDIHVTLPDGSRGNMPGQLAARYEEHGGTVAYFGKPYAPAFDAALALLAGRAGGADLDGGVDLSRVLHVGDSLAHDVAGANASGIALPDPTLRYPTLALT